MVRVRAFLGRSFAASSRSRPSAFPWRVCTTCSGLEAKSKRWRKNSLVKANHYHAPRNTRAPDERHFPTRSRCMYRPRPAKSKSNALVSSSSWAIIRAKWKAAPLQALRPRRVRRRNPAEHPPRPHDLHKSPSRAHRRGRRFPQRLQLHHETGNASTAVADASCAHGNTSSAAVNVSPTCETSPNVAGIAFHNVEARQKQPGLLSTTWKRAKSSRDYFPQSEDVFAATAEAFPADFQSTGCRNVIPCRSLLHASVYAGRTQSRITMRGSRKDALTPLCH